MLQMGLSEAVCLCEDFSTHAQSASTQAAVVLCAEDAADRNLPGKSIKIVLGWVKGSRTAGILSPQTYTTMHGGPSHAKPMPEASSARFRGLPCKPHRRLWPRYAGGCERNWQRQAEQAFFVLPRHPFQALTAEQRTAGQLPSRRMALRSFSTVLGFRVP